MMEVKMSPTLLYRIPSPLSLRVSISLSTEFRNRRSHIHRFIVMGFNSVYRVLQEVFPQVDSRALKAVAIEHSKDADAAVEVVLVEIIPNLPEKPLTVCSSSDGETSKVESTMGHLVVNPYQHEQSTEVCAVSSIDGSLPGATEGGGETSQLESTMDHLVISSYPHEHSTEACAVSSIVGRLPGAMGALYTGFSAQVNSHTVIEPVNLESLATSSYHDANGETGAESSSRFLETFGDNSSNNPDSGSSDNCGQGCAKIGGENVDNETLVGPVVGICETNLVATQETGSSKSASEKDAFAIKFVDSDDESGMRPVLTRSEEKCSTEFLQEIIEEAKNDKKTLMLAMNSVVDLMREVESKEKTADQAKEDATKGCSDILAKVDEVKQALLRAKEANNMHAGEVYAEKAILATELKELQHRLITLSDERNRSLAILDEMRKALETRLAAALDEIAAAEERKLENERAAREALLHQESLMEKVVEESKKLKLEAEENSKLQEFLMDRGRAIDILQGEIYVKCQDVLLLKEKFEKRIPLSQSLSSSQTSSILTSSGLSFRSVIIPLETEQEPEPEMFESLMKSAELGDSYGFLEKSSRSDVAPQSPKSPEETINPFDDVKVLLEDEWDFLDE
ncbi:hypothetical protein L1987_03755 [Smallanthus sonchifolius]|uniref:Uncharacterized protein n=1 Tax=Smallanthus sonchifolius TaxID=185202 RepID=A0ACB9KBN0_9ASTR|nr:hypothetical protein L1987_03755 [Smallanthus sonchifolius]